MVFSPHIQDQKLGIKLKVAEEHNLLCVPMDMDCRNLTMDALNATRKPEEYFRGLNPGREECMTNVQTPELLLPLFDLCGFSVL